MNGVEEDNILCIDGYIFDIIVSFHSRHTSLMGYKWKSYTHDTHMCEK